MNRYYKKPVAVVVNSGGANGYGVIVNLGREGVPIVSIDSNPGIIPFSKYASKAVCPDYLISEDKFIEFLLDLGKKLIPKPVLFVTNDLQLLCILKYKKIFEQYYHMPMASRDVVEKLVDKSIFYRVLEEFKLPHAKTHTPKSLTEAKTISEKIDYPYIIKPVQSKTFSEIREQVFESSN